MFSRVLRFLALSGVGAGWLIAALALLIDFSSYGGFSVQGVSAEAAAEVVTQRFLTHAVEVVAGVALAVILVFTVLGVIARLIHQGSFPPRSALRTWLETAAVALALHLWLLLWAASTRPQLYEAPFSQWKLAWLLNSVASAGGRAGLIGLAGAASLLALRRIWRLLKQHQQERTRTAVTVAAGVLVAMATLIAASEGPAPKNDSPEPADRRHVVLVALDSLRSDRLFPEAGQSSPMPFLSALLQQRGRGFTHSYVPIARTFPSWVSLLTSVHPRSHGVLHMFPTAAARKTAPLTLPAVLAQNGYHTAVFSDFAGDIFTRYPFGFHETHTPSLTLPTLVSSRVLESVPQLLPYVDNRLGKRLFPVLRGLANAPDAQLITSEFLEYVSKHRDKKTFSTLFYSDAHFPFAAPYPGYAKFTSPDYDGPHRFQFSAGSLLKGKNSEADIRQIRALYDGGLWSVDQQIERLVEALKARGILEDTLLIVTADHGENLGEDNLGFAHGNHLLGMESHRTPLFWVDFSSSAPPMLDQTRQVTSLDLAPTTLARLGLPIPEAFRGANLDGTSGHRPLLMETGLWFVAPGDSNEIHQKMRIPYPGVQSLMVVNSHNHHEIELSDDYEPAVMFSKHLAWQHGQHRLVYTPLRAGAKLELFDTKSDPLTRNNLKSSQPALLQRMKREMLAAMNELAPVEEKHGFLHWQHSRGTAE